MICFAKITKHRIKRIMILQAFSFALNLLRLERSSDNISLPKPSHICFAFWSIDLHFRHLTYFQLVRFYHFFQKNPSWVIVRTYVPFHFLQ